MKILLAVITGVVGIRMEPSCFPDNFTHDVADVKEKRSFEVGSKVEIHDLENEDWKFLNGKTGTLVGPSEKVDSHGNCKMVVKFDQPFSKSHENFQEFVDELPFKQENLVNVSETENVVVGRKHESVKTQLRNAQPSSDEDSTNTTPALEVATNTDETSTSSSGTPPSPRDYDDSAASILDLGSSFHWLVNMFEPDSPTISTNDQAAFESTLHNAKSSSSAPATSESQTAPLAQGMERNETTESDCDMKALKYCSMGAACLLCWPCIFPPACYQGCTGDDKCEKVGENFGKCCGMCFGKCYDCAGGVCKVVECAVTVACCPFLCACWCCTATEKEKRDTSRMGLIVLALPLLQPAFR